MSSKATFNLVRTSNNANNSFNRNMQGGAMRDMHPNGPQQDPSDQNDAHWRRKAHKYHNKIQGVLVDMQRNGKAIPAGYEKYLQPFSA